MLSDRMPAIVGVIVAGVTLVAGLYATADRTGIALPGSGGTATPAHGDATQQEEAWVTPDVFAGVDVSSLTYAEYIALLQQMSDPRGSTLPPGEALPLRGPATETDVTGREGWDSSSFPTSPPVSPPPGSEIYVMRDGPSDSPGRRWEYTAPSGITGRELCEYGINALVAYGATVFSVCAEHVQGSMYVQSFLSERGPYGPMLNISISENTVPCIDSEGACHLFGVFLRGDPTNPPPPPPPNPPPPPQG